ncbi:hypothetical protein AAG589_00765 [Isoptericola sp. F-RaC21]|uniref:hypothetical protein n=1 Tax=Isoptericola sp. F-RaC21 TaxID=3141452 RepID=UPI00315B954D
MLDVALFLAERLRGGVVSAVLLHAAWNVADALMPPTGAAGAAVQVVVMAATAR